jgi:DNA-binding transcriptional LysR family regulator
MTRVLDIVAMRSLIAIADCGGFHRAATAQRISQSAVSQHVRRLEKVIGRPLVARDGRNTRFTPDGQSLLAEARRIVAAHDEALRRLTGDESGAITIGTTEHAADEILPAVTGALGEVFPDHQVRFRLDRSARLNEAVDKGQLDLAVYVTEASTARGWAAGSLPLVWYSAPEWSPPSGDDPWPLIAIEEPCTIRRRALDAMAANDLPATVVCDAGYLAGVVNAARAGLGVALLATAARRPEGLVARGDLPSVAPAGLSARARRGADPSLVTTVLSAVRALLTPATPADQGPLAVE